MIIKASALFYEPLNSYNEIEETSKQKKPDDFVISNFTESIRKFKKKGFIVSHITEYSFDFFGSIELFESEFGVGIEYNTNEKSYYFKDSELKYLTNVPPLNDLFIKYLVLEPDYLTQPNSEKLTISVANGHLETLSYSELTNLPHDKHEYILPTEKKNNWHPWQLPYLHGKKRAKTTGWYEYDWSKVAENTLPINNGPITAFIDSGFSTEHQYYESYFYDYKVQGDDFIEDSSVNELVSFHKTNIEEKVESIFHHFKVLLKPIDHLTEKGIVESEVNSEIDSAEIIDLKNAWLANQSILLSKEFRNELESKLNTLLRGFPTEVAHLDAIFRAIENKNITAIKTVFKNILDRIKYDSKNYLNSIYQHKEWNPHGTSVVSSSLSIAPNLNWKMFTYSKKSTAVNYSREFNYIYYGISFSQSITKAIEWIESKREHNISKVAIINISSSQEFNKVANIATVREINLLCESLISCEKKNIIVVFSSGNFPLLSSKKDEIVSYSIFNTKFTSTRSSIQVGGAKYKDKRDRKSVV